MASYVAKIGLYNNFVARHYRDRLFYLTDAQYYDSTAYNVWAAPDESLIKVKFCSGDNIITMADGDYPTSITLTAISNVAGKTSGGFAHGYPDEGRLSANLYLSDVNGDVNCYLATVEITYPYSGMWCPINYTFDLSQNGDAPKLGGKQLALRLQGGRGLELLDQVQVTINSAKYTAQINNHDENHGKLSFYTDHLEEKIGLLPGQTAGIYYLPEEGYVIDDVRTWPVEFENTMTQIDTGYTFTMPSHNVEFDSTWKKGNFKIHAAINPSDAGIIQLRKTSGRDGDIITSAEAGDTVYFTYISNPAYGKPKNVKLTDDLEYTGPTPENGTDLGTSITYEANTSDEPVSNGDGGTSTTPANDTTGDTNTDEPVSNGSANNIAYEYSFVMPSKEVTISIIAEEDVFEINASCVPPEGGTITSDDEDLFVKAGQYAIVNQTPKDGYKFHSWKYWKASEAYDNKKVIESDGDRIRYYVFEARIEELIDLMSKTTQGTKQYNKYEDELMSVRNCKFNLGYLFKMPIDDVVLQATYDKIPYNVTVSANHIEAGTRLIAINKEFLTKAQYESLHAEDESAPSYEAYIQNMKTSSDSYSTPVDEFVFRKIYTGGVGENVALVNVTTFPELYAFMYWTISYGYVTNNILPDEYGVTRFVMPAADVNIVANYRKREVVWSTKTMEISRYKHTITVKNTGSAIDTFGNTLSYHLYKDGERIGTFSSEDGNKLSFTLKKSDFDRDIELKIVAESVISISNDESVVSIMEDGPVKVLYAPAPTNMFSYYDGENFQDVQLQLYDGNSWIEF